MALRRLLGGDPRVEGLPPATRDRARAIAAAEDSALAELARNPIAPPGLAADVRALAESMRAGLREASRLDDELARTDIDAVRRAAARGGPAAPGLYAQADALEGIQIRRAVLLREVDAALGELGAVEARAMEARLTSRQAPGLAGDLERLHERVDAMARAVREVGEV